jgi:protein-tyrosine phosphatase
LFYSRALCFHQHATQHRKAKVFVMCQHGICRSASLTYFLLRSSGISPRRAEALVRRARPCATIVRAYRESCEEYLRRRER